MVNLIWSTRSKRDDNQRVQCAKSLSRLACTWRGSPSGGVQINSIQNLLVQALQPMLIASYGIGPVFFATVWMSHLGLVAAHWCFPVVQRQPLHIHQLFLNPFEFSCMNCCCSSLVAQEYAVSVGLVTCHLSLLHHFFLSTVVSAVFAFSLCRFPLLAKDLDAHWFPDANSLQTCCTFLEA